jgi:diaminopimelate decarboxylase
VPLDSFFHYKRGELHCEGASLSELAQKFGTPLFVTSKNAILSQFHSFEQAFKGLDHLTCYSVKANYNLSILQALAEAGSGFDVNSGGELFRALKAGAKPKKIIFAGVAKTRDEIEYALKSKVLFLKAESLSELRAIESVAHKLKLVAPIALRLNPNVAVETHPYITTGNDEKKFGIDEMIIEDALADVKKLKRLRLVGLEMHIGSQIFSIDSFIEATYKMLSIKSLAESMGFELSYIDVGGGFPITYRASKPAPAIDAFADKLVPILKQEKAQILFEPGRFIVGNASVIVTETLYRKQNQRGKNFIIVDAAMTELIRPTLYEAYHDIFAVKSTEDIVIADVVGGVCETGDFFALDREVANVKEGELLAILSAGAYGMTMSSNYNARLKPAEVMVNGKKAKLIRKRETFKDLIQHEVLKS